MDRSRRAAAWAAAHPVDLAFGAVVAAAFGFLLRITEDGWYFLDDWGLIDQSGSLRGVFRPYSGHLSVAILGIYRVLAEAFGFEYGPYRVVGFLCLLAIPVSYHLTTRRLLGPPLAAVLALSTIAYANLELRPSSLNHYLVVLGAIGAAAALNRGPRSDWMLAGGLALALCGAGGGSAVAVAALVHNALVRPAARRWLVVLTPFVLWATWYLLVARTDERPIDRQGLGQAVSTAATIGWTPFQHLGFQQPPLAGGLLMAFVGYGAWRVRSGADEAANFLAWTAGLVVWCGGLGLARGPDALVNGFWQLGPVVFRYQVVTLAFVLLALVPRRPLRWPTPLPATTDPRHVAAASGMLLLVAGVAALALRQPIEERATAYERKGWEMQSVVLELRKDDRSRFPVPGGGFLGLEADEVLGLLDRYGAPPVGHLPLPSPPEIGAVRAGPGQATVSWTAPDDDGGSPIVAYLVTPYTGFVPLAPQRFPATATTQVVTGLRGGVAHRFKVQALNTEGRSGYSAVSQPVTPEEPPN